MGFFCFDGILCFMGASVLSVCNLLSGVLKMCEALSLCLETY